MSLISKALAAFIKKLEHNQYDTCTYACITNVCRMHITTIDLLNVMSFSCLERSATCGAKR